MAQAQPNVYSEAVLREIANSASTQATACLTWMKDNITMFRETRSELQIATVFSGYPRYDVSLLAVLCDRFRRVRYVAIEKDEGSIQSLQQLLSAKFPAHRYARRLQVELVTVDRFTDFSARHQFDVLHFPSARLRDTADGRATLLHALKLIRPTGHIVIAQQHGSGFPALQLAALPKLTGSPLPPDSAAAATAAELQAALASLPVPVTTTLLDAHLDVTELMPSPPPPGADAAAAAAAAGAAGGGDGGVVTGDEALLLLSACLRFPVTEGVAAADATRAPLAELVTAVRAAAARSAVDRRAYITQPLCLAVVEGRHARRFHDGSMADPVAIISPDATAAGAAAAAAAAAAAGGGSSTGGATSPAVVQRQIAAAAAASGQGFDAQGEPSADIKNAWWPSGYGDGKFSNAGFSRWCEVRAQWNTQTVAEKPSPPPPVPYEEVVEALSIPRQRVYQLPGPMRLPDIIDLFVDIWEAQDY